MGAVFGSLAKSCRSIFEKSHSTDRVKEVVETCEQASSEPVGMTQQLAESSNVTQQTFCGKMGSA